MQPQVNPPSTAPASVGAFDEWFTARRLVFALVLMFFGAFPLVLSGSTTFFRFDFGVLAYPFVHYQRECFWRGELPLWNPLSNCGAPFLAQWGTMALYPFALIYLLLPMPWSLNLFCVLHLIWGGLGMYLLAHRWTGSRFGASVAGAAFALGGVSLSCLIWPNYTVALGWLPWVIWRAEAAWQQGGCRNIVLAALAAAMQMLTGVPELILMTWAIVIALALTETIARRGQVKLFKTWGTVAFIILLVAGLAAAQLLPFFDLLEHSQRDNSAATVKWAMPSWGAANLVVPLFHYGKTAQGVFFQQTQEFLASYYPGAFVLVLGGMAVWRVRDRRVWLMACGTIFALLMAPGENGFIFKSLNVYGWLKQFSPAVGIARYPVKFMVIVGFAIPILAAYGVRWCEQQTAGDDSRRWRSLCVASGVFVAVQLALLAWLEQNPSRFDWPPVTSWNAVERALLLAAGVSLLILAMEVKSSRVQLLVGAGVSSGLMAPGLAREAARFEVAPGLGGSRIMISPFAEDRLLNDAKPDFGTDFAGRRRAFWSNLNALDNVPKVNGSSTLRVLEENDVQTILYAETNKDLSGLMNFLGVSHITAHGQIILWTNRPGYLPMVTIGQRPVFAPENEIPKLLTATDFDSREIVYLPDESRALVTVTNGTTATIASSRFGLNRGHIEYDAPAPCLMVIAQTFYHPWQARIDGQPAPLLRANHAFQAIQVPQGRHMVFLEYKDKRFKLGAALSLAALTLCMCLWNRNGDRAP
jgi:hypothetical protein